MATGQQANKISPRKFSEKIALLNKKEAEGNAEFEEIIKEVQATRSQSAYGNLNNSTTIVNKKQSNKQQLSKSHNHSRTNITSSKELEEVFESLIECVGNYEQEIQGKQRQQQNHQLNNLSNNEGQIDANGHYRMIQAPESIVPIQTPNIQPQPQIQFIKHVPPTAGDTNITSNSILPTYVPSFQETYLGKIIPSIDSQTQNMNICGQDNTTQCRTRVTSVGSADKKNLRQINEPPRYSSHQGAWISSNTDMYLRPACDKSWQKSCSDPALHVGCKPTIDDQQIISCSDNILTTGDCINLNIDAKTAPTNQARLIGQLDDNTFLTAQNVTCETTDKYSEYTLEDNSSIVSSQLEGPRRTALINASSNTDLLQQTEQQRIISTMSTDDNNIQFSNLPEHYNVNNSLNVLMNDVPGIKICSIEDDTNQSLSSINATCLPHNNSSTNLSNLQYNNENSSQTGCSQHAVDSASSITHPNESQQLYYEKSETTATTVEWSHLQQATAAGATIQHQTDIVLDPKLNRINLCSGSNNGQLQLFDGFNTDWSGNAVNDSSLNAPKVNNMLSTSDCGLTTNCHQSSDLDTCNNIIRSRSHNSIDYLTKHEIVNNISNCNNQSYNQPPQNQMLNQYDNHMSQFRLQIGHSGHCCSQSNCSMKPQYGSISPIDSSSNLTSPQSEQNSPGSSTNEYNEFLPYPSSSIRGRIQATNFDDEGNSTSLVLQSQMNESYTKPHVVARQQPPLQYRSHDELNQSQVASSTECIQTLNQPQPHHHLKQQQHHQRQQQQMSQFQDATPSIQGIPSLIGPCQSPSSSRRAHNQICRGAYSAPPTSRGPSSKN